MILSLQFKLLIDGMIDFEILNRFKEECPGLELNQIE